MADDFFYKKVEAYKKGKELTKQVYHLLKDFPPYETYALSDQLRRAAISIPSNIAEGMGRMSIKERLYLLQDIEESASEVGRIMSGLRKSLIQKQNINN